MIGDILFVVVIILFGALGIHHFIKARRGLRTGVVEGLLLGYPRKQYELEYEPEAFWVNVWAGFVAATVSAFIVFLGALLIAVGVAAYFGVELINL